MDERLKEIIKGDFNSLKRALLSVMWNCPGVIIDGYSVSVLNPGRAGFLLEMDENDVKEKIEQGIFYIKIARVENGIPSNSAVITSLVFDETELRIGAKGCLPCDSVNNGGDLLDACPYLDSGEIALLGGSDNERYYYPSEILRVKDDYSSPAAIRALCGLYEQSQSLLSTPLVI